MTIADNQIIFNGLTMGAGTPYRLQSMAGFRGLPTLANKDLPKSVRDGSYAGFDTSVERILQAVVTVNGTSVADVMANLQALENATVPIFDPTNLLPLSRKYPAEAARRYNCRPRQHDDPTLPTLSRLWSKVTLGWQCPDPTIYDDTLTSTAIAGSGSITNAGNWKAKCQISVAPSASPVTIVNSSDSSGQVVLAGTIPNPVVIDLLAETVVDGSGTNRFDLVDPTTTWFSLVPGVNSITVTNATATFNWRSAWIT